MKKLILTESDKKKIILAKEKAIMESFAKTFNSIKRLDENEINEIPMSEEETVYINNNLSDYFEIPYQNDGEEFIVNSGTLKYKNTRGWDSKHMAIFNKYDGEDLILKGIGHGWWKIENNASKFKLPKQIGEDELGEGYPRKSNSSYYSSPEGRDKPMHTGTNIKPLADKMFSALFGYSNYDAIDGYGMTEWENNLWKTDKEFARKIRDKASSYAEGFLPDMVLIQMLMDNGSGIKGRQHAERTFMKYFR